jgi:hypothetical protein
MAGHSKNVVICNDDVTEFETEHVCMQDDTTGDGSNIVKFIRHTIYDTTDGSVSSYYDTTINMTTAYTSVGTVSLCSEDNVKIWTELLCDTGSSGFGILTTGNQPSTVDGFSTKQYCVRYTCFYSTIWN